MCVFILRVHVILCDIRSNDWRPQGRQLELHDCRWGGWATKIPYHSRLISTSLVIPNIRSTSNSYWMQRIKEHYPINSRYQTITTTHDDDVYSAAEAEHSHKSICVLQRTVETWLFMPSETLLPPPTKKRAISWFCDRNWLDKLETSAVKEHIFNVTVYSIGNSLLVTRHWTRKIWCF